jgi:fibro-slime domain-containing protein
MIRPFLRALFVAILAWVSSAEAAKVVRLYNPWLQYGTAVNGKIHLVNYYPLAGFGPAGTTNIFTQSNGPWLELVVPVTLPAGSVNFSIVVDPGNVAPYYQSYGTNGIGGGDMDLGTALTSSDTVWIVPSPLPNGPAKVLTTAPKEMTVMLWNPFEHDATAQRPSMRMETGVWKAMDSARSQPGWYASYILGFNALSLTFRNADSSKTFGVGGIGLPVAANFDSMVTRNDTVWIWATPEPSGRPSASSTAPRMRTVMLLNPWDGIIPFQRPRINFGGGDLAMRPDPAYCGWSYFRFIDRVPQATFSNSRTGVRVGAAGFGSSAAIDLSAAFAVKDTAWVTTASGTGVPTVRSAYTGEKGLCEITFLAATVHDFDTSHPNFEEGSGASCGLVRGMVAGTLGPDRKPLQGPNRCRQGGSVVVDQFLTTQWFRDVPGVNASTCRDIPLALDSSNGNYRYDNTNYFPIDDFTTLANGQPNPHYETFGGNDGQQHNFHYCLESHGEFDYKRGQRFSFRGDDDVWFFIDNRLAVDLGGVHNPESGSVNLDTMGLVEGRTYNFDFFYCERQTIGANMRIETSMNLRTPSGFKVADTARTGGVRTFDLYISQRLGQGCSTNDNVQRTAGRFTLSGPPFNPPISLPGGVSYGGIDVDPAFGRLVFDSTRISGLPPGTYTLRILPAGTDTSGARSVVFVVPLNALPYFRVKPAYSGLVGTSLKVDVVSRTVAGASDSNAVSFVLATIPGLRFFRDSLQTSEIRPGDTLRTGAKGVARSLWVRGEAVGEYTLRVGTGLLDTVDLYPGISFQNRGLRYLDASGAVLAPVPAIDRDVRTSQQVWIEAVSGGTTCLTCQDTILLTGSAGLQFRASAMGAPVSRIRLTNGKATFWVHGSAPLANGVFRGTFADSAASAPWSPVTFRAPLLRFTDSTDTDVSSLALEVGESQSLWLRAVPAIDTCVSCDRNVLLGTNPELLASASASGLRIDSVRLVAGRARIWVRALAPVASGVVVGSSDSLWARDTVRVTAIAQTLRFVDSSGNDLSSMDLDILEPREVWLEVRGSRGLCTGCTQSVALVPSSAEIRVSSLRGGASIGQVNLVAGRAKVWLESSSPLVRAHLAARSDSLFASDTLALVFRALRLRFVDSLGMDVKSLDQTVRKPLKIRLRADRSAGVCVDCNQWVRLSDLDPEWAVSLSPSGARIDSVRLVAGSAEFWIESRVTNVGAPIVASSVILWSSDTLLLTFTARAPDSAFWFDTNGDGSADRLEVHLAQPWRVGSSIEASWPRSTPLSALGTIGMSVSPDSLTVSWTLSSGLAPLVTADSGSAGVLAYDGRTSLPFAIGEKIAPVPLRAILRYGTGVDTVRIPWSEVVAGGFFQTSEMVRIARGGIWSAATPLSTYRDTIRGELVLLYDGSDPSTPQPGDSLRFSPSGALRDGLGNVPGENARRVVLQGTDRAPLDAVMRDADGDGRADRVVLRLRSPLAFTESMTFLWPGPNGLEPRTAKVSAATSDSGGRILTFDLDPWSYGYTSCPEAGCANLGAMISVWGTDTARLSFPIRDEVPPVPVKATLRFGPGAAGPDTLTVVMSEPVTGGTNPGTPWFSTGKPSTDPNGTTVPWIGTAGVPVVSADGRTITLLVDTSFHARKGDSLRLTASGSGGTAVDRGGNSSPSGSAGWVAIEFGPHPVQLDWRPMPPVRVYTGWTPPAGESPIQILVRDGNGRWVTLDGSAPAQDTSRYGGIYLRFNRAMKGSAYLYDNLGIFVADVGFDKLTEGIESGAIEPDARGNYEVWLSWNGTSMNRALAGTSIVSPSGVYIFRVITHYLEEGRTVMLNQVVKTGWKH